MRKDYQERVADGRFLRLGCAFFLGAHFVVERLVLKGQRKLNMFWLAPISTPIWLEFRGLCGRRSWIAGWSSTGSVLALACVKTGNLSLVFPGSLGPGVSSLKVSPNWVLCDVSASLLASSKAYPDSMFALAFRF